MDCALFNSASASGYPDGEYDRDCGQVVSGAALPSARVRCIDASTFSWSLYEITPPPVEFLQRTHSKFRGWRVVYMFEVPKKTGLLTEAARLERLRVERNIEPGKWTCTFEGVERDIPSIHSLRDQVIGENAIRRVPENPYLDIGQVVDFQYPYMRRALALQGSETFGGSPVWDVRVTQLALPDTMAHDSGLSHR
jgi:hypothetical protein